jgi:HlyD family secretion protein
MVLRVVGVVALLAGLAWLLPGLFAHRAANEPTIARDGLVVETVTRGTLERSVTAAGVFVPDRVHVVASLADGVALGAPVRAGTRVSADTMLVRLANPDLAVAVVDAQAQLAAARAEVRSARAEADATRLDEDAALRSARAENEGAEVEYSADRDLSRQGLIGDLQTRSAQIKAAEDRDLVTIARDKIVSGGADSAAKIAVSQARVDQLTAELAARRAQLATLVVRAGASGTVQSIAIDPGQRVSSGTEIARIADDRDLKAVLQIAESDVRGVAPGQLVRIVASDAGQTLGRVTRLAPAAQNGTVAVDVALDRIPPGARADQNVDGTVIIRRAANVLSLARPANANDGSRIALYRLDRDATHAYRTEVTLGYGSDDRVRILSGLNAGDRVIVSDTSALDAPILRITQ